MKAMVCSHQARISRASRRLPLCAGRHPAGLLTLLCVLGAWRSTRCACRCESARRLALKFFEIGFLGMAALWFVYLMVALFFYFADAFNADRRNNAMLFWKSMPVSDFSILGSKMLAGLTIFPALIFGALLGQRVVRLRLHAMTAIGLNPRLVAARSRSTSRVAAADRAVRDRLHGAGAALVRPVLRLGRRALDAGRPLEHSAGLPDPGLLGLVENLFFRGVDGHPRPATSSPT